MSLLEVISCPITVSDQPSDHSLAGNPDQMMGSPAMDLDDFMRFLGEMLNIRSLFLDIVIHGRAVDFPGVKLSVSVSLDTPRCWALSSSFMSVLPHGII
jgi:hypothetical protein